MSTKQEILFELFAITRAPIEGLDQAASEAVATEVDRFQAGTKTKTKTEGLKALLTAAVDVLGIDEAANRIAFQSGLDELTRVDANAETDYVKEFTKDVVRSWLQGRDVKITKKTSVKKLNALVVEDKNSSFDDAPAHASGPFPNRQPPSPLT